MKQIIVIYLCVTCFYIDSSVSEKLKDAKAIQKRTQNAELVASRRGDTTKIASKSQTEARIMGPSYDVKAKMLTMLRNPSNARNKNINPIYKSSKITPKFSKNINQKFLETSGNAALNANVTSRTIGVANLKEAKSTAMNISSPTLVPKSMSASMNVSSSAKTVSKSTSPRVGVAQNIASAPKSSSKSLGVGLVSGSRNVSSDPKIKAKVTNGLPSKSSVSQTSSKKINVEKKISKNKVVETLATNDTSSHLESIPSVNMTMSNTISVNTNPGTKIVKTSDHNFAVKPNAEAKVSKNVTVFALSNPKVFGEKNLKIITAPFEVGLEVNGIKRCAGSIISRKYIITAAYCTYGKSPHDLAVQAGSLHNDRKSETVPVKRIHQHSKYDPRLFDYDISILELAAPLHFRYGIESITLANSRTFWPPGTNASVADWKKGHQKYVLYPDISKARLRIIDHQDCENVYGFITKITSRMLCATVEGDGKEACRANSGGPLVVDNVLAGVIAWKDACAYPVFPEIYTSIPAFRGFIKDVTGI